MIEFEVFRETLRTPPDAEFRAIDLDKIMIAGGRIRRRRRLLAGAAAGACVLTLVAVVGTVRALPGDGRPVSPGGTATSQRTSPNASQSPAATTFEPTESLDPIGDVIATGVRAACGERVFWVRGIADSRLPGTTFGIVAGCRGASGNLAAHVTTNETETADAAAGFHALQVGADVDGSRFPGLFGYYAGPAAKITAVTAGTPVTARQAAWSNNPKIIIFWFDGDAVGSSGYTGLAAYDAAGNQLPTGNTAQGVG